tara:strand:- start:705 stop:1427 length:723 start_codon:yes stop_codon:yes gene_type:complete
MNNSKEYFKTINQDELFASIESDGFAFLPPINELDCFAEVKTKAKSELQDLTYKENSNAHLMLEESISLKSIFEPALLRYARESLGYKGSPSNKYKISRHVKPGKSSEAYRSHFDSHIYTIVFPISIPITSDPDLDGSLVAMPNLRKDTSIDILNIAQKAYYKRYANKKGLENLMNKNSGFMNVKFHDYRPLLFLGRTTFHCNYPLSNDSESSRITFLSHFYDRDSSISIGNILRKIRNR